jgi:alkanesulfonate monooxygenase SsuD/methylene tetrahydromethanopterin reductase-like flavin-dependent oxidoreductase (luciferase family)
MELGYLISPEYTPGTDMIRALKDQTQIVSACRELGMSSVFVSEHLSRGQSVWFPPLLLLSRLCEYGEGMTFGTAVLAAGLHNPVALAEYVAFLDAATSGRFVLGLGAGWNRSEFMSMGASMTTRGRALDETVEILRILWGSEEPASYGGEVFTFRDTLLSFRPAAGPQQPIWLGASSAPALRRAARVADAWLISAHMSIEQAAQQMRYYEAKLSEYGHAPPSSRPALRSIFVAPTMEAARRSGGDKLVASYEMFNDWGLFTDIFHEQVASVAYEKVTERAFVGDPDTVAELIVKFVLATGANLLLVRSQWLGMSPRTIIDCLELLCTEVMPRVRRALGTAAVEPEVPRCK